MAKNPTKVTNPPSPTIADKRVVHSRLIEALKQFVQVLPEDTKEGLGVDLLEIARQKKVNILAFIAPEIGVKVAPSRQVSSEIGLFEEFGLQCALAEMKDADPEMHSRPLWLLVHSPGGLIPSSYMIAKRLRAEFKEIVAFIPHVAASGGTLIALSANEIVMGDFGRLGPVDPQVPYSPGIESDVMHVSSNCMERAIASLEQTLKTTSEIDVTVPNKVLSNKLDPILREDWKSESYAVTHYLQEILTKSGYDHKTINDITRRFVYTIFPHDFVIDKDRAKEYGIKVSKNVEQIKHLELMQEWLVKYMLIPEYRHYIRFVTVPKEVSNESPNGKNSNKISPKDKNNGKQ